MSKVITHKVGSKPSLLSFFRRWLASWRAKASGYVPFTVPNQSMSPTLRVRDVARLDPSAYKSAPVAHGEVVVYRSEKHGGLLLAGRAVALPGETVELRRGSLMVNGEAVAEPYVEADSAEEPHSMEYGPATVPAGEVFLLGDFRDLSEDSRFVGPIALKMVVGRVVV
jgi:signal peptidase I